MASSVDSFSEWVRPHLIPMANLASRLAGASERDDVVQESLARAWRRWETYRPERGTPRTWLLAIVADQARRSSRRRPRPAMFTSAGELPEHDLDIERAIVSLSRRQRLAVELHYFLGLNVSETAAVMRCAEGTVKSTLSDARSRLRELLKDDDD